MSALRTLSEQIVDGGRHLARLEERLKRLEQVSGRGSQDFYSSWFLVPPSDDIPK